MADFLLELFSEEIPARMQADAVRQLQDRFSVLLAEAGLAVDSVVAEATPRRLALIASGLAEQSAAVTEERRGPRVDAPDTAIEGFLRSTGLSREQLEERDTSKGLFLFANLSRDGRPAAEILAEKLPALLQQFDWPKSQRWGAASASTASPRWVRPLRAIVALLGREVVEFEALGLKSGRETFGHRFMGGRDPLAIDHAGSYRNQLLASFVLLSADERRARIEKGAETVARKAGLVLRPDAALVAENAGLTEWPVALSGRFDPIYLEVPNEIISLTMATNQKYFAVESKDGQLAPAFVCVANLEAPDKGEAIIAGNERVLSARLADARFFWEQDKLVPLEEQAKKLDGIVFHEKLGTIGKKVGRVVKLAGWLAEKHFPDADIETVKRAARLAKADLVTGTIGEFPELQGIIGGYIAGVQGEKADVVAALRQHYVPAPVGDVPVAVTLADQFDSLVSLYVAGERATGSHDPFAMRRMAITILSIILDNGLRCRISDIIKYALEELTLQAFASVDMNEIPTVRDGGEDVKVEFRDGRNIVKHGSAVILDAKTAPSPTFDLLNEITSVSSIAPDLTAFIIDRLKVQQREAGVRHDLIDAVCAIGDEDDLVRLLARVRALQAFVKTEDGSNLLTGYRRAANILKAEEKRDDRKYSFDAAVAGAGMEAAEAGLLAALSTASAEVEALVQAEDFAGAMQRLSTFRAPVDRFFGEAMVNDTDRTKRARRLGLLAGLRDVMHKVADFSRIEG